MKFNAKNRYKKFVRMFSSTGGVVILAASLITTGFGFGCKCQEIADTVEYMKLKHEYMQAEATWSSKNMELSNQIQLLKIENEQLEREKRTIGTVRSL